tara:strand:+ start:181 stop:1017 length:837 start_codon:yes stop_codon:yes gene_type:complete
MSLSDQLLVENRVKNSGTSFYWGMKLLDKNKKRAMFAIYAFCREVDDIADKEGTKKLKEKKLQIWKKKINLLYQNKSPSTSILRELSFAIDNYNLEKKDLYSVIEGMIMDVREKIQFPSKKKLNKYCYRVAVSVGLLSIKVFGLNSKFSKDYAFSLGMAFQLTNIVRDFSEDLEIERCYLPSEILKKYDIKKEISVIKKNPLLQDVLQEVLKEALRYFKKSDQLSKKLNEKQIIASEIMKFFYQSLHKKMYNKKVDLTRKVRLNPLDKFQIFLKFLVR